MEKWFKLQAEGDYIITQTGERVWHYAPFVAPGDIYELVGENGLVSKKVVRVWNDGQYILSQEVESPWAGESMNV